MIAVELGVEHVEPALRLVRALGGHRYVAGRLHLVHAFAFEAIGDDAGGAIADARAWAKATLGMATGPGEARTSRDGGLDPSSRDERLWRRSTDAEVVAVLDAFWTPGQRARAARDALRSLLDRHDLPVGDYPAFDEGAEGAIHPLAVDAGWELVPLHELDVERHRGAIAAFGDALAFESAVFEEETAIPVQTHLYELPALGPRELLDAARDDGSLTQPFVVWTQGNEVYLDYVLRGVRRAAKIE
jgi:hypothetical protein